MQRLPGNVVEVVGGAALGLVVRGLGQLRDDLGRQRLDGLAPLFERLGGQPTLFDEGRPFGLDGLHLGFRRAHFAGVILEHGAGGGLGRADLAVQLPLHRRVEPQARELPEQLRLGFLVLADALAGTGEALGDFILLAADVAHRLFEAGQGLGSTQTHRVTIASRRRRAPA